MFKIFDFLQSFLNELRLKNAVRHIFFFTIYQWRKWKLGLDPQPQIIYYYYYYYYTSCACAVLTVYYIAYICLYQHSARGLSVCVVITRPSQHNAGGWCRKNTIKLRTTLHCSEQAEGQPTGWHTRTYSIKPSAPLGNRRSRQKVSRTPAPPTANSSRRHAADGRDGGLEVGAIPHQRCVLTFLTWASLLRCLLECSCPG